MVLEFLYPHVSGEKHLSYNDVHSGRHSTLYRLKLTAWWPGMYGDIENWVRDCPECQQKRLQVACTVDKWPASDPFQRIHIDWAILPHVGNLLIIVDSGSGWIEAFLNHSRSTNFVIKCLRTVFARFGIPEVVVSDNAPEFTSHEICKWLESIGSRKLESPPYFPRSNGQAERAVQTVKRALVHWKDTKQEFSTFLQKLLLHKRISSTARGRSPA